MLYKANNKIESIKCSLHNIHPSYLVTVSKLNTVPIKLEVIGITLFFFLETVTALFDNTFNSDYKCRK